MNLLRRNKQHASVRRLVRKGQDGTLGKPDPTSEGQEAMGDIINFGDMKLGSPESSSETTSTLTQKKGIPPLLKAAALVGIGATVPYLLPLANLLLNAIPSSTPQVNSNPPPTTPPPVVQPVEPQDQRSYYLDIRKGN